MAGDSSAANTAHSNLSERRGLFPKLIELSSRIFGVLLFTIFMSVIVEWVLMTWYYENSGHQHAKDMFKAEYTFLTNASIEDSLRSGVAVDALETVTDVIETVFFKTGVLHSIQKPHPILATDNLIVESVKAATMAMQDYLLAMLYVMMTFMVRLAILILSLPVFVIFGFIGLTDGLMRRDLRKFRGVHESSFVYHIAKGAAMPLAITGCIMYLSMPWTIHPNFVITPYAILFGYTVMIASSKFKKYL